MFGLSYDEISTTSTTQGHDLHKPHRCGRIEAVFDENPQAHGEISRNWAWTLPK
jgi:hypothetical protein